MKYLLMALLAIFIFSCDKTDEVKDCDTAFHMERDNCVSDIKMVDCIEEKDAIVPTNAEFVKKEVEISWNKKEMKWAEPEACNIECKTGYTKTEYGCEK